MMARLASNNKSTRSIVPSEVDPYLALARASENSNRAHQQRQASENAVPRKQRPLKSSLEEFAQDTLLQVQFTDPQSPQQRSILHDNVTRATPRRAAKAAVKYGFAESSPDDEALRESPVSEWVGESDAEEEKEEEENSEVLNNGELWDTMHVPTKFQQFPIRSRIVLDVEALNATGKVIDLTSPEKSTIRSVLPLHIATTKLDEFTGGFESSSESDSAAIIRFSPPRLRSPSKRPPPKSTTPPQSPIKSKLNSPQKMRSYIPPTPHRPSIDAFWSQDVVNQWNEQHSPRKVIKSPRKIPLPESDGEESDDGLVCGSPQRSPMKKPAKSPTKPDKSAAAAKKTFEVQKHQVAEDFLRELDEKIGGGQITKLAESTGGIKLVWSKKLNSTAGRANWRREAVKSRDGEGQVVSTTYRHLASIELAEKVIDDEHRLLNVLAHEYCHLANFMLSNVRDQPHGASFKRWAAKVSAAFAYRGIEVTTKHSYEIKYKYAWMCVNEDGCGIEYQRHSRSIDPLRHTCGKCKGRLKQVRPVPRKNKGGSADEKVGLDGEGGGDGRSEYQKFVKEHFSRVREQLGAKSPMKEVMKELGTRYRSRKEEIGRSVGDAQAKSTNIRAVEVVEILDSDEEDGKGGYFGDRREESGKDRDEVDRVSRVLDFLNIRDE